MGGHYEQGHLIMELCDRETEACVMIMRRCRGDSPQSIGALRVHLALGQMPFISMTLCFNAGSN